MNKVPARGKQLKRESDFYENKSINLVTTFPHRRFGRNPQNNIYIYTHSHDFFMKNHVFMNIIKTNYKRAVVCRPSSVVRRPLSSSVVVVRRRTMKLYKRVLFSKTSPVFPGGSRKRNPAMTTSAATAKRKGDPQHMLRRKRSNGNS